MTQADVTSGGDAFVRVEHEGAVARLTLDSLHNRNALSSRLVSELYAALTAAAGDPAVRVIVVTGSGRVFCSGADLRERLEANKGLGPEAPAGNPSGRHTAAGSASASDASLPAVFSAIAGAPKPVLARVNGAARAGGIGLIASCDLAVAPVSATFALSEVRVGVAPAMIAVPALRVMQLRALTAHALSGEAFSAQDAVSAGLLTAAVSDRGLDEWVDARVASFLRASPAALATTKRLLAELRLTQWEEGMGAAEKLSAELFASADAAEGMAAFLEKRAPSWVVET